MKKFFVVLGILCGMFLGSPGALAQAEPSVMVMAQNSQGRSDGSIMSASYIAENDPVVLSIVNTINGMLSNNSPDILYYNGKTGVVSFDYRTYHQMSAKDRRLFMKESLGAVSKSKLGEQRKSKLYHFIAEQDGTVSAAVAGLSTDTAADFYKAASILKPFTNWLSIFLGIACIAIFALLGVSFVLDMAYITLPIFQSPSLDENSIFSRIVSPDARTAVKDEMSSGRNALLVWAKKKIVSVVILSVILLYLVSGSLYDLVGLILGYINVT